MTRISAIDLNQINNGFTEVDTLRKQISELRQQLSAVHKRLDDVQIQHAPATSNNLTFNWTGATGTLDWNDGSVLDRNNVNVPVKAGSISGLAASTYHWLAWNKEHQQMVAKVGVTGLLQNSNNIVICQVFTGGGGATGVAGGGGSSSSASDLSGSRYKLF